MLVAPPFATVLSRLAASGRFVLRDRAPSRRLAHRRSRRRRPAGYGGQVGGHCSRRQSVVQPGVVVSPGLRLFLVLGTRILFSLIHDWSSVDLDDLLDLPDQIRTEPPKLLSSEKIMHAK
jgi:hypothetical protein